MDSPLHHSPASDGGAGEGRRRSGRKWLLALAAALLCLAVAGLWLLRADRPYHFRTVTPGILYRSGTLNRHELEDVHRRTGIRTIVNLRLPSEYGKGGWYAAESAFAAEHGVALVNVPLNPRIPPSAEQVRRLMVILADPVRQPVLVHCEMGVIRTGMVVAAYQVVVEKRSAAEVLRRLPMFGRHLAEHPEITGFVETLDQEMAVAPGSRKDVP